MKAALSLLALLLLAGCGASVETETPTTHADPAWYTRAEVKTLVPSLGEDSIARYGGQGCWEVRRTTPRLIPAWADYTLAHVDERGEDGPVVFLAGRDGLGRCVFMGEEAWETAVERRLAAEKQAAAYAAQRAEERRLQEEEQAREQAKREAEREAEEQRIRELEELGEAPWQIAECEDLRGLVQQGFSITNPPWYCDLGGD